VRLIRQLDFVYRNNVERGRWLMKITALESIRFVLRCSICLQVFAKGTHEVHIVEHWRRIPKRSCVGNNWVLLWSSKVVHRRVLHAVLVNVPLSQLLVFSPQTRLAWLRGPLAALPLNYRVLHIVLVASIHAQQAFVLVYFESARVWLNHQLLALLALELTQSEVAVQVRCVSI